MVNAVAQIRADVLGNASMIDSPESVLLRAYDAVCAERDALKARAEKVEAERDAALNSDGLMLARDSLARQRDAWRATAGVAETSERNARAELDGAVLAAKRSETARRIDTSALQALLEAMTDQRNRLIGHLQTILDELGTAGQGYSSPVANACRLVGMAIAEAVENEDPSKQRC